MSVYCSEAEKRVLMAGGSMPRSLADEAYCHIKRMILAGELRSGDKISEKEIAARLEVSRTPIREALKMLEQYGVVEFKPRSYAKVASITREETSKLARVRVEIEALAVRILMEDKSLLDAASLRDKVERSIAALEDGNRVDAYLFDSAFHLELGRQSGNNILYDVMERLDAKSQLVRVHARTVSEQYLAQLREHATLVNLLEKGREAKALELVAKHITPRFWAARGFDA